MAQETPEYLIRQLDKVKQPRTLVKVVRAQTRELKRQRKHEKKLAEAQTLEKVALAALEVPKELIRAIGSIGQGVAQAHGTAAGAWLGNTDPLTWVGGAVATAAYLTWLGLILKKVGEKLGLKELTDMIPLSLANPVEAFKDIAQGVAGRDDENGLFGIGVTDATGNWDVAAFKFFTNELSQEAGFIAQSLIHLGKVHKFTRSRDPLHPSQWLPYPAPPGLPVIPIPGNFMITGIYPPGSQTRVRVSAGYTTDQEAQAALQQFIDQQLTGATDLRVEAVPS